MIHERSRSSGGPESGAASASEPGRPGPAAAAAAGGTVTRDWGTDCGGARRAMHRLLHRVPIRTRDGYCVLSASLGDSIVSLWTSSSTACPSRRPPIFRRPGGRADEAAVSVLTSNPQIAASKDVPFTLHHRASAGWRSLRNVRTVRRIPTKRKYTA